MVLGVYGPRGAKVDAKAAGRGPVTFEVSIGSYVSDDMAKARDMCRWEPEIITDEMVDRCYVLGSPQNCIDKLRELEKLGVSRFCVYLAGLGSQPEIREQIRLWSEEIIPEFK